MIRKRHPRRRKKPDIKLSEEDLLYLDKVAIEIMKIYVSGQRPTSFDDSMKISRVAYRQGLAMLNVKKTMIKRLILESGVKLTI